MTDLSPLRVERRKRKLTLKHLADELGVSEGQMSRIEREGTTSLPHAMKLANLMELPIATFAPRRAA